jgi:hypothetical protein
VNRVQRIAWIVAAIGTLACLAGVFLDMRQFLEAYLWAYWFWLGMAIGCVQILMLYHLTGGAWGFVIQRILEAGARTFPVMFVLSIPLVAGTGLLYRYAMPAQVAVDGALQHKAPYLNAPFVITRLAVSFLIWWLIAWLLIRWSDAQDRTADFKYVRWRMNLSGPGIVIFTVTVSFVIVDWIMALEPYWYSTMFPGFYVVGQGLTALALAIIVLRYLAEHPPLSEVFSAGALHDLGNLLLAAVILWAYVQLAQLIITWSGNQPREIVWYLDRTRGNWAFVAAALAIFHFFFPFFYLLGRRNKRQGPRLAIMAIFILVMHMVDNFWNVEPVFHHTLSVHWLDFAAPIALGGIWVAIFLRLLASRPLVPAHDPRLVEALEKA